MSTRAALVLVALCATISPAAAQGPPLALPQPSPAATVTQQVGLTDVTISYHRPAVNKREVWGKLVPYDQVWRAGANENTTIAFSSDVTVGGQKIAAGSYGLHMIPTQKDWTVILSRESRAWGSFFYDQKDDATRFTVTPRPSDFVERLAYTFDEPSDTAVTATLHWEKMAIPIAIQVDTPAVVAASLRTQLRGLQGFFWQPFAQAASYCANHNVNLEEAATWAERAVKLNENFATLRAQALVAEKRGDAATAQQLRDKAMTLATEADMNNYGYQLLGSGKTQEAIAIFRKNVEKYPASWNAYDSLGEGLAAGGQKAEAITQYQKARSMVKDDTNQKRIDGILKGLGAS